MTDQGPIEQGARDDLDELDERDLDELDQAVADQESATWLPPAGSEPPVEADPADWVEQQRAVSPDPYEDDDPRDA